MNKTLGKKSAQNLPLSDESVLYEAVRQWVEVCMLHLEQKQKVSNPRNDSKENVACQTNQANSTM